MASTNDDADDYTPGQLRRMDEQTARQTLTVDQYERRETIIDLYEEAAETEQQFEQEAEEVVDLTVRSDPEQLGTEVDLFGNDVIVYIQSENRAFRQAAEKLDAEFDDEGTSKEEVADLPREDRDRIAGHLLEMLDATIRRWNGHNWQELPEASREAALADARADWGVDGLLLGWMEIAAAVREEREAQLEVVESFRGA